MMRMFRAAAWTAAAVVLAGAQAKGQEVAGFFFGFGLLVALALEASLPFGLLLHAWRPALVDRIARAYDRRGTAALLVGAGALVIGFLLVGILWSGAWQLGVLAWLVLHAYLLVGFTACSRRQGMRMLRTPEAEAGAVRPLVLGWLARAGATATPLLWPVVLVYLAAGALGAPVVALFGRESERSTGEGAA